MILQRFRDVRTSGCDEQLCTVFAEKATGFERNNTFFLKYPVVIVPWHITWILRINLTRSISASPTITNYIYAGFIYTCDTIWWHKSFLSVGPVLAIRATLYAVRFPFIWFNLSVLISGKIYFNCLIRFDSNYCWWRLLAYKKMWSASSALRAWSSVDAWWLSRMLFMCRMCKLDRSLYSIFWTCCLK